MADATSVSIGLVDPETLVRNGIAKLIEGMDGFQVAFQINNGQELQAMLASSPLPELLIMELKMPGLSGFKTLRWLKEHYSYLPVIILTSCRYDITLPRLVADGARCLLSKTVSPADLQDAIRNVLAKGYHYTDLTARALLSAFHLKGTADSDRLRYRLSQREWEVWELCTTSLTYDGIAEELCVSVGCVNKTMNHLFDKLDVANRTELALLAKDHGVLCRIPAHAKGDVGITFS